MTVYRTGTDSVLTQSLLRAAQNGKEVFKQLTGLGRAQTPKQPWQAPISLQQNIRAARRANRAARRAR